VRATHYGPASVGARVKRESAFAAARRCCFAAGASLNHHLAVVDVLKNGIEGRQV
jgi:hypothetical protein